MLKRGLRTRIARLKQRGATTTVLIELNVCRTQTEYEEAFAVAWSQVPAGATVYCWMRELTEAEYSAMVTSQLPPPRNVLGIYFARTA